MSPPEQGRILETVIPGPTSLKPQEQRTVQSAGGPGAITMPVSIERAGGGIPVGADGNHTIDMAPGIAVTRAGASHPAVTSAGAAALDRFVRPVAHQDAPEPCLQPEAGTGNPWPVPRHVNGVLEPVVNRP